MLPYLVFGGLVVYVVLVRSVRYRHVKHTEQKYGSTPAEFMNLNYKDAQNIFGQLGLYECPWPSVLGKPSLPSG